MILPILRHRPPYTCRRILPTTGRRCAAILRAEDRSTCEPCDEAEARAWDHLMFAPLVEPAALITPVAGPDPYNPDGRARPFWPGGTQ